MGGIIRIRVCKSCGWEQSRGVHSPEPVIFAIGFLAFAFLYPKIDWDAAFFGQAGALNGAMALVFLALVIIMPGLEIWRTIAANRGAGRPFDSKCPECGGREFEDGGGFY